MLFIGTSGRGKGEQETKGQRRNMGGIPDQGTTLQHLACPLTASLVSARALEAGDVLGKRSFDKAISESFESRLKCHSFTSGKVQGRAHIIFLSKQAPESLKLETLMPRKLGKCKHVLFLKLFPTSSTSTSATSPFPPSSSTPSSPPPPMETAVLVLELSGPSPLENLERLLYEIYLPLLTNPQNQAKWGEIATKQVKEGRRQGGREEREKG